MDVARHIEHCIYPFSQKFSAGQPASRAATSSPETWWSRELPSAEELAHARETLASLNQQVDYIITHSVAPTVNKFLDREQMQINLLLAFLNEISETVQFKRWYFGSCHLDKNRQARLEE